MANELGTILSLLLLLVISAMVYVFSYLPWYWQVLALFFILLCANQKRSDITFLSTTLGRKTMRRVLMLDNIVISAPFLAFNSLRGNCIIVILIVGVAMLTTFTKRCNINTFKPTKTLLRMGGIEYEKGFRESIAIFLLSIALVVIGIFYDNLNMAKIATIFYLIVYLSAFPNVIIKRNYMICYRSLKRLLSLTIINTLAYTVIFGLPFLVLFTFKWHWQGASFCGILYIVACLSALEMSLLRYHINGNVILSVVSLLVLLFLAMVTLMMPLLLLVYVITIILTYFFTYNIIKEKIYGYY